MARRIKKAKIAFISLVPAGANKMPVIYKADGTFEIDSLSKLDEQGELLAVVYAAEHRDSQGDIASAEVVKQMAYDFIANGANIDIRHNNKPVTNEQARIAESFLVQKGDSRFAGWKDRDGAAVDLAGAWATVIKIDDADLRKQYRDGKWNGVSMGGTAVVENEKSDEQLDRFAELFLSKLGVPNQKKQDKTMDEKTLSEVVAKSVGEMMKPFGEALTKIAAALTPAAPPKPEDKKEPKAPVYKGSFDDEKALAKFQRELELFAVQKDADMSTPEGVKSYRDAVTELRKSWAEADAATKKTNQTEGDTNDTSRISGLTKEQSADFAAGRELFTPSKK